MSNPKRIGKLNEIEIAIKKLEKPGIITQIIKELRIKILAKLLNIELIKESKEFILNAATTISYRKNIKVEPINATIKNKMIYYCDELPFGIISFNRYINIETMNNISSYNKNKKYYVSLAINLLEQNR